MDAARFAELCRNSTHSPPPDAALIEDYVDDIREEFTKRRSSRVGAAEERAMIDQALAGFDGFPIEPDSIKENLPPRFQEGNDFTPFEEARLRVLGAVRSSRQKIVNSAQLNSIFAVTNSIQRN